MRARTLATVVLAVIAAQAGNVKGVQPRLSLRSHCLNKVYLAVFVHTLKGDGFPDVDLRLLDPRGRSSGGVAENNRIPKSQSGKMILIPKNARTKVIAVEVCDALQGDYTAIVSEHKNEQYGFSVEADGGDLGSDGEGFGLATHRNSTCKFWFRLSMGAGHMLKVHSLDANHMQTWGAACEPANCC